MVVKFSPVKKNADDFLMLPFPQTSNHNIIQISQNLKFVSFKHDFISL